MVKTICGLNGTSYKLAPAVGGTKKLQGFKNLVALESG